MLGIRAHNPEHADLQSTENDDLVYFVQFIQY
jgi:hypothetical protein